MNNLVIELKEFVFYSLLQSTSNLGEQLKDTTLVVERFCVKTLFNQQWNMISWLMLN